MESSDTDDEYDSPRHAAFAALFVEASGGESALERAAASAAQMFSPEELRREILNWNACLWGDDGRLFLKDLIILARLAGSIPYERRIDLLDSVADSWRINGAMDMMVSSAVNVGKLKGPDRARASIEASHRQLGMDPQYYTRRGGEAIASALFQMFMRYERELIKSCEPDAPGLASALCTNEAAIAECAAFVRDHASAPQVVADEMRKSVDEWAQRERPAFSAVFVDKLAAAAERVAAVIAGPA